MVLSSLVFLRRPRRLYKLSVSYVVDPLRFPLNDLAEDLLRVEFLQLKPRLAQLLLRSLLLICSSIMLLRMRLCAAFTRFNRIDELLNQDLLIYNDAPLGDVDEHA